MEKATLAGIKYLATLTSEERRRHGTVYTPAHLVAYIFELAGYPGNGEPPLLLDPCCGAGAFLEHAVQLLADSLRGQGLDLRKASGRATFLQSVSCSLFGVDLDPTACALARVAVRDAVARKTLQKPPASFFEDNVLQADFLRPNQQGLPPAFDFIVGNPPYVSTETMSDEAKLLLRQQYTTARGRFDLYGIFIERSLELLRPGGRLAMITPDKFLTSQTSRPLRELMLSHARLRKVARFRSHRTFAAAATVPCITVLERGGEAEDFELLDCVGSQEDARVHVAARSQRSLRGLTSAPWNLAAPALEGLAARIKSWHPTLAARTWRMSAGLATGRDELFVLPGGGIEVESELLQPAVRGRDLRPFRIADPELNLLLPYRFDELGSPQLVDLKHFPKAAAYLEQHRSELTARHCVRVWGKAWYDLHDTPVADLRRQKKILVPDVARTNRFVADEGNYFPLHSVYYLIPRRPTELHFLTAVLNSEPIEFLIRLRAPIVKDGFSRFRKQFLAPLPLPELPDREAEALVSLASEDWPGFNDRIYALFQLGRREIATIRKFLTERNQVD